MPNQILKFSIMEQNKQILKLRMHSKTIKRVHYVDLVTSQYFLKDIFDILFISIILLIYNLNL